MAALEIELGKRKAIGLVLKYGTVVEAIDAVVVDDRRESGPLGFEVIHAHQDVGPGGALLLCRPPDLKLGGKAALAVGYRLIHIGVWPPLAVNVELVLVLAGKQGNQDHPGSVLVLAHPYAFGVPIVEASRHADISCIGPMV